MEQPENETVRLIKKRLEITDLIIEKFKAMSKAVAENPGLVGMGLAYTIGKAFDLKIEKRLSEK